LLVQHTRMFSRFQFDLSPQLKTGTNLIAIYVSMERIPKSDLAMGEAVTVNLTASKIRSLSKGMYGPLAPGFDNRAYDLHGIWQRSEEHTSELQSLAYLVCRLLLEKQKNLELNFSLHRSKYKIPDQCTHT